MKVAAFLGTMMMATAALADDPAPIPPEQPNGAATQRLQANADVLSHDQALRVTLQDLEKAIRVVEQLHERDAQQALDAEKTRDWLWKNFGAPAYAAESKP